MRFAWVAGLSLLGHGVLLVVGCGDDVPDAAAVGTEGLADGGASTTSTSGTPDPDGVDTAPVTEGSSGPASTETGFDPPEPACGNGFVEAGEQCDDGNRLDDDQCSNACQVPCGLEVASIVLPPTAASVITAAHVVAAPDGGAIVAGLLREITTDRAGNEQIEPDVAQVMRFDAEGRLLWSAAVTNPDGNLRPNGLAVDDEGEVYVIGTGDDPGGAAGIFAVRLAVADGTEVWRHEFPGSFAGEDDVATGIAIGPDGDPVLSGQVRVADGDDDIWLRKLAAADGVEAWTTSYSGASAGMFSTDDGGPVTVDGDGRVWVLGTEYVDFATQLPVLLRFAADGGPAELVQTQMLGGDEHQYFPIDLEASGSDTVYAAYARNLGQIDVRVVRFDGDGVEQWALSREDFETDTGSDWQVAGLAPSGDELLVVGRVTNDVSIQDAEWNEVWIARIDDAGEARCRTQYRGEARGLLPPSITAADAAASATEIGLVSGLQSIDGDVSLWLGRFRPQ